MNASAREPAMNKVLSVAFGAIALGMIGGLGWPLGWIGASGAALIAALHYTTPQLDLVLRGNGIKRRPLLAFGYAVGLVLLVGSALSLLVGL